MLIPARKTWPEGSRPQLPRPGGSGRLSLFVFAQLGLSLSGAALAAEAPRSWSAEWPRTDFARTSVDFAEILSGRPPKDGNPPIDGPVFVEVGEATNLAGDEPVIGVSIDGDARAYPLRILIWHEIVISWEAGNRSALDTAAIAKGRDVGDVVVQRETASGLVDIPYDQTFAFVFHAFRPDAPLHR